MSNSALNQPSRRQFLRATGIIVAFSFAGSALAQTAAGGEAEPTGKNALPDDIQANPWLDSWVRIDEKGKATVFTGKAELGQGIETALLQVAAEELDMHPSDVAIITADTERTPDEGLTAASHSMQYGGPAMRNAAANVRMLLLQQAATMLGDEASRLTTTGKASVRASDGREISYGEIVGKISLHRRAIANPPLRLPQDFRTIGKSLPRLDIPAKVTGGPAFVQDLRFDGMLHARVIRGPSEGTVLELPPKAEIEAMPGVFLFVQNGQFAAIVCEREWDAITVMRKLQSSPYRPSGKPLPVTGIAETLKSLPSRDYKILDVKTPVADPVKRVSASYTRPWISHGSIGPSCAVGWLDDDGQLTIWSHSQGIFDVRRFSADLLAMPPEKIRGIQSQGAGCYGQNGADDVAADAALIAAAIPGRPIRVQWMREQEFGWEPLGPGMLTELEAGLDSSGQIVAWKHDVWSNPHDTRPTSAGGVLAGREVERQFAVPDIEPIPMPAGDGSRNSNPLYALPNMDVTFHFLPDGPLRTSALRSLGGHLNIFSIESMFDELALAGGLDPLDLRLSSMKDRRALDVMNTGADAFGWRKRVKQGRGHGFGMAFARYKNLGAYCALFMDVTVARDTGVVTINRAVAAVDCGEVVNPDGIRNQIEGGLIQSVSWCTREEFLFDETMRTSFDWSAYPIIRFSDVPLSIDVAILPRPGEPFLGVAEAAQGPASAALANALADATGVRFRDMPLTPEKVRKAIVT
ncbi:xanthine dehydrogenase family protein molybdopterin-binding subunit [Martelella mediterranea]|uniref:Nicotinate dehydrogenase subunit B n=1 Tax=Martelella mediterranea DSM 17316 TaxID=1122214 RepID=A0A1U9Z3P2_9HYPH|nr:molybdopterin cofactor-binding domain-containing protein [Martelella mediterranea]AQZ52222.1 Nicotinate dehydrogenase subunit B [Martelella mediterranea DSM 17316]